MSASLTTYLHITANLGNQESVLPDIVSQALIDKKPSLLRLSWEILTQLAQQNKEITELMQYQQEMQQYLDHLKLSLNDMLNNPPKNLSEQQANERNKQLQSLQQQLLTFQQKSAKVNDQILYTQDRTETLVKTFRKKMLGQFEQLDAQYHTYLNLLLNDLSLFPVGPQRKQEIHHALFVGLHHPDIEATLIDAAQQNQQKSFTAKIKNWLSSGNTPLDAIQKKFSEILLTFTLPPETIASEHSS